MTMVFFRVLVCAALLSVAAAAAENKRGGNGGIQIIGQKSNNTAIGNLTPTNQNSANANISNNGNGNKQGVTIVQSNPGGVNTTNVTGSGTGRKLQARGFQITVQKSNNTAIGNLTPPNQNSANGNISNNGNGNKQSVTIVQSNPGGVNTTNVTGSGTGRKLLTLGPGIYRVDNHGDVYAFQAAGQKSGNVAAWNSGPVDQNSANAAITSIGNGNSQGIWVDQQIGS